MKKLHRNSAKTLAFSASVLALAAAAPASAQDVAAQGECPVGQKRVGNDCVIQTEGADGVTDNDPNANDVVDVTDTGATGENEPGAIVVTGSRLRRDTYKSIAPLQVITTERSQEVGLFDPSQILQRDESAAGQQVDATFGGFVVDNGPGSATLNLRGLGADRTLLLVNGRRLAPAGVEGAPSNPSINLLPGSLIDRYDLLLDGASSVYGSDAVAGVANVILRKNFDGLELFGRGEINPQGAGEDYTISAAYGKNFDRGFLGFGIEYDHRDAIRFRDRKFFRGCETDYEVDKDGNIYTLNKRTKALVEFDSGGKITTSEGVCRTTGFTSDLQSRFIVDNTFLNSVFKVRGGDFANLAAFGLPGFGKRENQQLFPVDLNKDGRQDVDDQNYLGAGRNDRQVFLAEQNLINAMAYGEYTLPGDANITPYFEANYSRAKIVNDNTGIVPISPRVPGENPFNPCNIQAGGADCRAIDNAFFLATGGTFAIFGPAPNPRGPTGVNVTVRPTVAVSGDRNNFEVTQEQYRGVLGVRGDLPFLGSGWEFDTSFVYSRSVGKSVRRGIREDKLAFALGIDPTIDFNNDGKIDNSGDGVADDYNPDVQFGTLYGRPGITPCNASALKNPGAAMPDLTQGCVPVNLFAPSLLDNLIGEFATAAERDYVIGERSFDTIYEQKLLSAYVTGKLFQLQGGPIGVVVGGEYRQDKIDSKPNTVASNGLLLNFFADQGAEGKKYLLEGFAEAELPLIANKLLVQELTVNVSGRVTKEEFYGTNFTYSFKGGWRPVNELLLKFSYGTSFRAPNLRENFLKQQTSFLTLFDPCAVPAEAFDFLGGGGYQPGKDPRTAATLANCIREGRDPTKVGLAPNTNTLQTNSVQITSGGSFDIEPETSRSLTTGFAYEDTFFDGYEFSLNFNYYDIKLKNAIVEANPAFVISDCFTRDDGNRSAFCDRISYDPLNSPASPSSRGLIRGLKNEFLNFDTEQVRGMDFNASFGKELVAFGRTFDLGLNLRANRLLERSTIFIDAAGNVTSDEDQGEFGLPKWTGRAVFTADVDKFRFTWQTAYTGKVRQDIDSVDAFADVFQQGPDGVPTTPTGEKVPSQFSNTCLGAGRPVTGVRGPVAGDGIFCRDVGFAGDQFLHTASVRYKTDRFTFIVGVDNIFNTAPPKVDPTEVTSIANSAIGLGYDYDGREIFASVQYNF